MVFMVFMIFMILNFLFMPKDRIICNRNGHVKSEVMNSDDQKAQVLNPNVVTAAA